MTQRAGDGAVTAAPLTFYGQGSRRYALESVCAHEAGHILISLACEPIPIVRLRIDVAELSPGVFYGSGIVTPACLPSSAEDRVALAVGGYCAEVLFEGLSLDFEAFCATGPDNARLRDIQNAREHSRAALERRGRPCDAAAVDAYVADVWLNVTRYLSRPETWATLARVRRFAIERFERGASDVLSPSESAFLDAIARSIPPPNSERAQDNRAHIVPIHDTIGEHMDIETAALALHPSIDPSHSKEIAKALRRAGPGGRRHLVECLNTIAERGGLSGPRIEAAPSSHVELTTHRSTSPARRAAPSSDSRVDAKFAALAGVAVAEFRQHRAELAAVDDEERATFTETAGEADARRAERLCAAACGIDLATWRAANEHLGAIEPHQGGRSGFSTEQLAGIPTSKAKQGGADDDGAGDEGSGDDDDGDEDGGNDADSEAEKKALRTARALGWSGSGKEFLRAWRADRAAARNG